MTKALLICLLAICPFATSPALARSTGADDPPVGARNRPAERATRVVEAVSIREATALKLDGELTDEVWARAPKIDGFLQRDPKEGAAATYRTRSAGCV